MTKRLRCYLGFHRWQRLKSEGGEGWYKLVPRLRQVPGSSGHTVDPRRLTTTKSRAVGQWVVSLPRFDNSGG